MGHRRLPRGGCRPGRHVRQRVPPRREARRTRLTLEPPNHGAAVRGTALLLSFVCSPFSKLPPSGYSKISVAASERRFGNRVRNEVRRNRSASASRRRYRRLESRNTRPSTDSWFRQRKRVAGECRVPSLSSPNRHGPCCRSCSRSRRPGPFISFFELGRPRFTFVP